MQADVVIGVPDSGLDAALGYSQQSGIPYGIGFLKNKYIGRTFIQPNQKLRENTVRIKLNPIADTVKGRRVVLVDDSIVRGTTSRQIVQMLREAGATEVHFLSSAPEFLYPCYFGVDVDSITMDTSFEDLGPGKSHRRQPFAGGDAGDFGCGQPGLFERGRSEEDRRGL